MRPTLISTYNSTWGTEAERPSLFWLSSIKKSFIVFWNQERELKLVFSTAGFQTEEVQRTYSSHDEVPLSNTCLLGGDLTSGSNSMLVDDEYQFFFFVC